MPGNCHADILQLATDAQPNAECFLLLRCEGGSGRFDRKINDFISNNVHFRS